MSEVVDISSTVLIPAKYLFLHLEKCLFSLSIFNLSSAIFILDISPLSDIWPTKLSLALLAVFSLSWWYTLKWKFYIYTHTYICNQPTFSSIAVLYCILDKIIFIKLWVYSYTTELYLRFFYIFAYHQEKNLKNIFFRNLYHFP